MLGIRNVSMPFDVQFTRGGVPADDLKSGGTITATLFTNGVAGGMILPAGITFVGKGVYRINATAVAYGDLFVVFETTDVTVDRRSLKTETTRIREWLETIYVKSALIAGVSVGGSTPAYASFNTALEAPTAVRWEKTFDLSNFASDTWQAWAFTVKANADADDDASALLAIKKSNPAQAGLDGIVTFNRRGVANTETLRLEGAINVLTSTPSTMVNVVLTAVATDLPPSEDSDPYAWELDLWRGNDKERIGYGTFAMPRSVRRETTAPVP